MHRPGNLVILALSMLIICSTTTQSKRTSRRNRAKNQYTDQGYMGPTNDQGEVCELEVKCNTGRRIPARLPIVGPAGPSGMPGSPGLPGKPGAPGKPGDSVRTHDEAGGRAAFFVGLDNNKGPVKKNMDLVFDKIITNVGDAFNADTGRFTAPFNGTYQFSVTVSAQGRQRAAVELVLNGKMVSTFWAESLPLWASASGSAILNLESGDQVWLVLLSRASHLYGYMYSTFSGHSLFRGL